MLNVSTRRQNARAGVDLYLYRAWKCLRCSSPSSFLSLARFILRIMSLIYWPSASLHTLARKLQTIQYLARSKVVQAETRELASLTRGKIKPGEKDEWLNEQLYVPPLPPTNLRGCNLIRIQYDVYVSKNTVCLGAFPLNAFTHTNLLSETSVSAIHLNIFQEVLSVLTWWKCHFTAA